MTEAGWLSDEASGRLIEQLKRIPGLPPRVRGRKYRLASLAIAREYLHGNVDPKLLPVFDAVERLCEGQGSLADVSRVIRDGNFSMRSDTWPDWGGLARYLGSVDAFSGVRGVAGTTLLGWSQAGLPGWEVTEQFTSTQCRIIREIFGNPFRPVAFAAEWQTDTAIALAHQMYDSRDFGAMPILADALQDAGCDDNDILSHCRDTSATHVRGCWVVDLVLGNA